MPRKNISIIALTLLIGIGSAGISYADCIRSCTAKLEVRLTYQPAGQPDVERKTEMLPTTESLSREGRMDGKCWPHKIALAKKRACTDAVRDLLRTLRSGEQQREAVCEAVKQGMSTESNPYPAADWYQIDEMIVRGRRDAIRMRGEVEDIDRRRFRCVDGQAFLGTAPQLGAGGDAAPPPPPSARVRPAPPPPPSSSGRPAPPPPSSTSDPAPPPPPTLVNGRQPDLYISKFELTPAVPVQGQTVDVHVEVYNRGTAPAGPFTVKWWPGENYPEPACSWSLDSMAARGGRVLKCTYSGYPSWYSNINTKVVADTGGTVNESVENNNMRKKRIRVAKP